MSETGGAAAGEGRQRALWRIWALVPLVTLVTAVSIFVSAGGSLVDLVGQNPPAADTFDVRRQPNHHVGFGGPGPHFCLGAHLARREITVMFRELFNRIGDIEATTEPQRLRSNFIHGIKHVDCAFTPTA